MNKSNDISLLVLRLAVGGLLLLHGISKLRAGFDGGLEGIHGMLSAKGLPEALAIGVYLGEVIAPVLLLAGWFVRIAGGLIVATMVMSIWLAYGADGFQLNGYGGLKVELNLLYLAGALVLALSGGGRLALPRFWQRGEHE